MSQHFEAETKWLPFYRQHFPVHFFFKMNIFEFRVSLKISLGVKFVNKPTLAPRRNCLRIGDKPLSEPIMDLHADICCIQSSALITWPNLSILHMTLR